ncbi:SH3 domain-containing protein [Zhenhengia yiwuensis]|uniref:SH3 domain-containing protein n=1 Tax=Zhenhengia yiwuensis TaxID=2763666 RepID=A0A926EIG7_9FIRM|nr:SH3 domain-containing protein [Zhenhengia yiwuensis]MBC8579610.1 SH3 domain-containing protein [Zhenhengia yiwuensis]MBS5800800.1 SH3 domain-containing protein [Clostridiales bacterium]MDY3369691.1 SH3 domain-containing protein [Zhenhengia yiwuensis]
MKQQLMKKAFLGLLMMQSVPIFANVFAVVQDKGAVAYCNEARAIYEISKGSNLRVVDLQEEKDTYRIDIEGQIAEIDKNLLHIRKVIAPVTVEGTKVRKEPSPNAQLVEELVVGEVVSVLYQSGNWYNVVLSDQTEGFIYKDQLKDTSLKLLPVKEFKTQKVEVLNWATANQVMPRGSVATILDVYTGKRFKIKRTFGTNHADVEALTKADTQVIKGIWGGFSWERRPVIVEFNGRYLAASLAGMPHAGDSLNEIKGNGMNGVIDLHFRGSKRHKEGNIAAVVDPQHQAAINVAAKYVYK